MWAAKFYFCEFLNFVNIVVQARFLKNHNIQFWFEHIHVHDHDNGLYCSSWTLSRSRSRTFSWEARSPILGLPPPVGAVKMRSSGLTLWSGSSQGDDDDDDLMMMMLEQSRWGVQDWSSQGDDDGGGGDDDDIMTMMEPPWSLVVIGKPTSSQ